MQVASPHGFLLFASLPPCLSTPPLAAVTPLQQVQSSAFGSQVLVATAYNVTIVNFWSPFIMAASTNKEVRSYTPAHWLDVQAGGLRERQ